MKPTLIIAALALAATTAHAERTMEPREVMELDRTGNSAASTPDTDKEAERVLDSRDGASYQNDRDDAQKSGGKPDCGAVEADPAYDFIRRLECARTIGNDDFGAGYSLYAGVYAWERGADDKMRVDGGFDTQITVFGRERTIIGADAFFESSQAGAAYGRIDVVVLDSVVEAASRELAVDLGYDWSLHRTFVSASTQIPIGGVFSVGLEAGATGSIGANLSGGVANDIEVTFTPRLDVTGYASASVAVLGGAVAEAGVDINLLLLGVSLPIELAVDLFPTGGQARRWSIGGELVIESLSGWLDVWVTAAFGLIEHRATVASWDGIEATFALPSEGGQLNL